MFDPTLLEDVVKFIEISSFGMKRATDEVQVHREMQKRAAALKGEVLKDLLDNGLLTPAQKQAGEAMLGSHAESLQLLKLAVDRIKTLKAGQTKKAGDLGEAADDDNPGAQAQHKSLSGPYVGQRTSEKKASDLAILSVLDNPR